MSEGPLGMENGEHMVVDGAAVHPDGVQDSGVLPIFDRLLDLELPVSVALGSAELALKDVLRMRSGSVIELDKEVGQEVDLLVQGTLVARGEIVLVNENYGIRISRIATGRLQPMLCGERA